ncbi:Bax inhibitor-1 family protein [Pseudomonas aeruginosa]
MKSAAFCATYGRGTTLAFSGLVAYVSQQMRLPYPNVFVVLIGFYGLFFPHCEAAQQRLGSGQHFALTGFMGSRSARSSTFYLACPTAAASSLGVRHDRPGVLRPVRLCADHPQGHELLSGFITAGFFVLLGAVLYRCSSRSGGLQLAISAGFVLFSSAMILYQTSAIIHGGERNYIMATISLLYVSIYNLV